MGLEIKRKLNVSAKLEQMGSKFNSIKSGTLKFKVPTSVRRFHRPGKEL